MPCPNVQDMAFSMRMHVFERLITSYVQIKFVFRMRSRAAGAPSRRSAAGSSQALSVSMVNNSAQNADDPNAEAVTFGSSQFQPIR